MQVYMTFSEMSSINLCLNFDIQSLFRRWLLLLTLQCLVFLTLKFWFLTGIFNLYFTPCFCLFLRDLYLVGQKFKNGIFWTAAARRLLYRRRCAIKSEYISDWKYAQFSYDRNAVFRFKIEAIVNTLDVKN